MTSGNSFSYLGVKKKSWLYDTRKSASRKRVNAFATRKSGEPVKRFLRIFITDITKED